MTTHRQLDVVGIAVAAGELQLTDQLASAPEGTLERWPPGHDADAWLTKDMPQSCRRQDDGGQNMGWESRRRGGLYYYRTARINGKPRRIYLGAAPQAWDNIVACGMLCLNMGRDVLLWRGFHTCSRDNFPAFQLPAMIHIPCPHCGKTVGVKNEFAADTATCPLCRSNMTPAVTADIQRTVSHRVEPVGDVTRSVAPDAASPVLYDFLAPPQEPDELGRLGPYRILEVLGVGGMGIVFRGEDPGLERKVAVKAMLGQVASESARKRFLREARAVAKVEHDHVVPIYQVGEDRGIPYLAMPLLKGEPLDKRLTREGALPEAEVVRITREAALGLAAAHAAGLVHRDIKPGNLWLEGDAARVKVLDFGLARSGGDSSELTSPGAVVGTPGFMAPEQVGGEVVDSRADLFSLGCVAYQMATGQKPFKGTDMLSTLKAVATHTPLPPHNVNTAISRELSDIIVQLLEKAPDDRPASAQILVEWLDALADGAAPAVPSKTGRGKRPLWHWLAGTAALVLVFVAIVLGTRGEPRQNEQPHADAKGEPERPSVPVPTPKKTDPDPKIATSPKKTDPDPKPPTPVDEKDQERALAHRILKLGGTVRLLLQSRELSEAFDIPDALPTRMFHLGGIALRGKADLAEADLDAVTTAAQLVELDLSGSKVSDRGIETLAKLKSLRCLRLTGAGVTDSALERLTPLDELRDLSLYDTPVTPKGVGGLSALPKLERLWLCNLRIAEAEVEALEKKLPKCRIVTDRRAAFSVLGVGGGVLLQPAGENFTRGRTDRPFQVPPTQFRVLSFDFENARDLAKANLSALEGFPGMKVVIVTNQNLPPTKALESLLALPDLEIIRLSGDWITDELLDRLSKIKTLRALTVDNHRISAEGEKRFRQALPNCKLNAGEGNKGLP